MDSHDPGASRSDPLHFERAKAVLAGGAPAADTLPLRKVLGFAFGEGGTDVWIRSSGIDMCWVTDERRTRHSYVLDLAPGILWDLMAQLGVERIDGPTMGALNAEARRFKPMRPNATDGGVDRARRGRSRRHDPSAGRC